MTTTRFSLLSSTIIAVLLIGLSSTTVQANDLTDLRASVDAMQARLSNLETENAELRANQNDQWLSQRRADEVKALVNEVLADADSRASLQNTGLTAGHNGCFFIASPDGNFLFKPGGAIGVRYIFNSRDDASQGGNAEGFSLNPLYFWAKGHIYDPALRYVFVIKSTCSGDIVVKDAYVEYDVADGWVLTGGQFNAPFLFEQSVSSLKQFGVDRSAVNGAFSVGNTQGVQVAYNAENWRAKGMIHNGTGGTDGAVDTDFAFCSRAEYLVCGTFQQFTDFATWSTDETGILLGAGFNWELTQPDPGAFPALLNRTDYDIVAWPIAAASEFNGVPLAGAITGCRFSSNDSGSTLPSADTLGCTVQGSYAVIPDKANVFVTYANLDLDEITGIQDKINIITFGGNYYWHKHNSRAVIEVVLAGDPISSTATSIGATTTGLMTSGQDNQTAVRAQYQAIY